jgi:aminoacyl tRNA synthase complex-interacting multifunctional protein 1
MSSLHTDILSQSQLQAPAYYAHPAITRYFDFIQSQPSVRRSVEPLSPAFSLVHIDLENTPKLERRPDPPKEKKKKDTGADAAGDAASQGGKASKAKKDKAGSDQALKDATASADTGAATIAPPASASAAPAQGQQGKEGKAKKEKKPKEEGAAAAEGGGKKKGGAAGGGKAAAEEGSGEPVPSMIDLRVGHIVESKYCGSRCRTRLMLSDLQLRSTRMRMGCMSRWDGIPLAKK